MTVNEIQRKTRAVLREAKQEGRSGGPRTPEGKAISAGNALRHGLAATNAVMPGENAEERARRIEDAMVAFGVTNGPVARLVAAIEDDLAKIERVDRIERGLIMGRVEELIAQTDTGERAKKTGQALQVLGKACQHLVRQPLPAERGPEIDQRIDVMQSAINVVPNVIDDTPMDLVAACHAHLMALADERAHPELPAQSFVALIGAAQVLLDWLVKRAERDEGAQADLRAAVAGIALPAEAELKKLARYSRMIEESLARRLAALEALRKATENVTAATEEQAREFRLRLRVVK